ncbi:MAG: agglutinin biogenesis protein MshP [Rhodoferax sp.]|jgi:MSHA biogenesis protein MshP|nr:agglutinin biogenesis protein MshP [Rhodoferax sp.]MBP7572855.1 agglutinin biogenesis protein MshP [Rhodoferax sp.]
MVSALFILVVLAVLGAAMATISARQQRASASELNAARAYQSARTGLEWGAFSVLVPAPPAAPAADAPPGCFATTNLTMSGELAGFVVSIACARTGPVVDGDISRTFYQLQATACNVPTAGSCAATPASPSSNYVERRLSWTVAR